MMMTKKHDNMWARMLVVLPAVRPEFLPPVNSLALKP
jgi:hypothetical protein